MYIEDFQLNIIWCTQDQADYWLNIHLVYEWVRQLLTDIYSVYAGLRDYWWYLLVYAGSGGLLTDIHSAYGIGQRIADYAFAYSKYVNTIAIHTYPYQVF